MLHIKSYDLDTPSGIAKMGCFALACMADPIVFPILFTGLAIKEAIRIPQGLRGLMAGTDADIQGYRPDAKYSVAYNAKPMLAATASLAIAYSGYVMGFAAIVLAAPVVAMGLFSQFALSAALGMSSALCGSLGVKRQLYPDSLLNDFGLLHAVNDMTILAGAAYHAELLAAGMSLCPTLLSTAVVSLNTLLVANVGLGILPIAAVLYLASTIFSEVKAVRSEAAEDASVESLDEFSGRPGPIPLFQRK